MKHKDFPFIHAKMTLEGWHRPSQVKAIGVDLANYYYQADLAMITTLTHFLKESGLLRKTAAAWNLPTEQMYIMISDLTEEGQEFIYSGARSSWLGSLDRKSNNMLRRGISNEERVKVRQDPKGLYKRLEKFRNERASSA